ncbi:MAG TPA: hypothetical protein PLZ93_06180 [Nocardioides sp.]|uniref:hypothetical protein n=1 Tax=uncultured Nocardioides sp. TaxID=198441 RepID=UPI000EC600C9|nr:hypothetical protein [uncultured Nocardioides sp.]HCB02936.1 hypothetical protein [Nocardioides sp.]HRD61677.1 hypothetical protein [Nocardioides sp.]HRI95179.1 hypothetical protein [Nocardioides sp.]HRK45614.1 hypothetical protein [Nocardioides sp.]
MTTADPVRHLEVVPTEEENPTERTLESRLDKDLLDEWLYDAILAGRPIAVWTRDSSTGALHRAAGSQFTALEDLAEAGIDFTDIAVPENVLRARARAHRMFKKSNRFEDGKPFSNYCYVEEENLRHGLIQVVQWGTGSMHDEEDYEQPAQMFTAEVTSQYRPILTFANESRAWGRSGFGYAPLVKAAARITKATSAPVFIGWPRVGIRVFNHEVEKLLFDEGQEGGEEAKKTFRRTRRAMRRHQDVGKVGLSFQTGAPGKLPPALDRRRSSHNYRYRAFWDTPGHRPAEIRIGEDKSSLACVPGTQERSDPVAILREYFDKAFTPRVGGERGELWDYLPLAEWMSTQGFSYEALRDDRRDRAAVFTLPPKEPPAALLKDLSDHQAAQARRAFADARHRAARRLFDLLWSHRDFFMTGRHTFHFDDNDYRVEMDFPDDVPILSQTNHDRIEEAQKRRRGLGNRKSVYSLSGLDVLVNDRKKFFVPNHYLEDCFRWGFDVRDGGADVVTRSVYLPHDEIICAILDTLFDNDLLLSPVRDPITHSTVQVQLDEARAALAVVTKDHALHKRHIAKPELEGDALAEATMNYNAKCDDLRNAERLVNQLAEKRRRELTGGTPKAALLASDLLQLVIDLTDPASTNYREDLRQIIENFVIVTSRLVTFNDLRLQRVDFSFTLRLRDETGEDYLLPVQGRYDTGSGVGALAAIIELVDQMREGVPAETMGCLGHAWQPWIRAALLGDPSLNTYVLSMDDPRLLRLCMAVMFPPLARPPLTGQYSLERPEDVPRLTAAPLSRDEIIALAPQLGESPETLLRLAETWHAASGQPKWLVHKPRVLAALHEVCVSPLASDIVRREWRQRRATLAHLDLTGPVARIKPCPQCGSRDRKLLNLREVQGLVCTVCRTDGAGALWPTEYDRYETPQPGRARAKPCPRSGRDSRRARKQVRTQALAAAHGQDFQRTPPGKRIGKDGR